MPPAPTPGHTDPLNVTLAALSDAAKRAGGAWAKVVTRAPGLALKAVKRPDKAIGGAVVLGASAARTTAVHRAPLSPVMTGRGTAYTISTLDLPFPELRAAGKDRGGSVNDAFLAGVAGAARIYHERHGQPVATLRFNMPISLRRPGEAANNAVTIARFELPVDIKNPDERVEAMRAVSVRARKEPALYFADVLAEASRLLPVQVVAEVAKSSDITTSNVPGPPVPLWVAGAATERVYPLVPTIGAAVNITLLSYAKQVAAMCVATDDAAVPDSDVFLECLVEGFAEIGVHAAENATDPLA
jgi:hypothetical protein